MIDSKNHNSVLVSGFDSEFVEFTVLKFFDKVGIHHSDFINNLNELEEFINYPLILVINEF